MEVLSKEQHNPRRNYFREKRSRTSIYLNTGVGDPRIETPIFPVADTTVQIVFLHRLKRALQSPFKASGVPARTQHWASSSPRSQPRGSFRGFASKRCGPRGKQALCRAVVLRTDARRFLRQPGFRLRGVCSSCIRLFR